MAVIVGVFGLLGAFVALLHELEALVREQIAERQRVESEVERQVYDWRKEGVL